MTLSKQTIQLSFIQTPDTSISPSLSQQLQSSENLVVDKFGQVTKVWGYEEISNQIINSTDSVSSIKYIASRGNELVVFTETGVYKYASSLARMIQISRAIVTEVDKTSIIRNNYNQSYAQMTKFGDTLITVYRDSRGGYRYSAYDEASSVLIKNDVSLGTIHKPQFFLFNSKLYIFYVRNSDNNVCLRQVDTQSYNISTEVAVSAAITDSSKRFLVKEGSAAKFCIAYVDASTTLTVSYYDVDGSLAGNRDAVPNSVTHSIDASEGFNFELSGDYDFYVAYTDGADISIAKYDREGVAIISPTVLETTTNMHAITFSLEDDLWFAWDETDAIPQNYKVYAAKYTKAGVVSTAKYILGAGLGLVSEVFLIGSVRNVATTYTSVFQPNVFVMSEYGNVAAKFNKDSALQHRTENLLVVPYETDTTISIAIETRTRLNKEGDFYTQNYGISVFDINFGDVDISSNVLEDTLFVSGSIVKAYDGASFCEEGFLLSPESSVMSATSTATRSSGSITATGKLTFTSVGYGTPANSISVSFTTGGTAGAEVVTVVGSAISVQIQTTVSTSAQIKTALEASVPAMALISVVKNTDGAMTAPATVTLTGGTGGSLSLGSYQYVAVYSWLDNFGRTHRSGASEAITTSAVANDAFSVVVPSLFVTDKSNVLIEIYRTQANGTVFYLASYAINDPTSATTAVTDTASDATIATQELLYTTGGVLSNDSPVTAKALAIADNRLLLGGIEGSNRVFYSKEVQDGLGLATSDFLSINTGAKGGKLVALKGFLDGCLVFKETCVGFITGQFATDAGVDVSLKYDVITEEVGCVSKNAIVEIDKGVAFQSERGICLVGRDMNVSFIGQPVEEYRTTTFTGATLLGDIQTIVFLGETEPTVCMNYGKNFWSTFPGHVGLASCSIRGDYYYLTSDDRILKKSSDTLTRGGQAATTKFKTPWFQVGGLAGFERLYEIAVQGVIAGPFAIKANIYYDHEQAPREQLLFTSGDVGVFGEGTFGAMTVDQTKVLQQIQVKPRFQKCTAVCVEFEEVVTSESVETEITWHGVRIVIGLKKGSWKFDASKAASTLLGG